MQSISSRLNKSDLSQWSAEQICRENKTISAELKQKHDQIDELLGDIIKNPSSARQIIEQINGLEDDQHNLLLARQELRNALVNLVQRNRTIWEAKKREEYERTAENKVHILTMLSQSSNPNSNIEMGSFVSNPDWEIDPSQIKLSQQIGEGQFGTVYRAVYQGKEVAVKKLLIQEFFDPEAESDFLKEMKILSSLRHPNLLLFMGACSKPKNLMMVTEFLEKGSLIDLLGQKDPNKKLSFRTKMNIAIGIAQGMNCLHLLNPPILHLDLKTANILIGENFTPKVADFGLSILKTEEKKEMVGSPFYMSPEVFLGTQYDAKADVYSFGILLWELIEEREPYDQKYTELEQLKQGVCQFHDRPKIPPNTTTKLRDLWQSLWNPMPAKRISFNELLQHGTLTEITINSLVHSEMARYMWKRTFPNRWEVKWEELRMAISRTLQITEREMPANSVKWECLKVFLRCDTEPGPITLERFSDMLQWIGPFEKDMFERSYNIVSAEYFHGFASALRAGELLNKDKNKGAFLVRFSSSPGSYTLSQLGKSDVSHVRISYNQTERKFFLGSDGYSSLAEIIKQGKNNKKSPLYPLKKSCKVPTPYAPMLQRFKSTKSEEEVQGNYFAMSSGNARYGNAPVYEKHK